MAMDNSIHEEKVLVSNGIKKNRNGEGSIEEISGDQQAGAQEVGNGDYSCQFKANHVI
jgi:hypothetical protein